MSDRIGDDGRDPLDLLRQARERAAKLVAEVRRQRDELRDGGGSPMISETSLSQGRAAMDQAVASAERMLGAITAALGEIEGTEPKPRE